MAKQKSFYRAEKVEALRTLRACYREDGNREHIPQICAIDGCTNEASKWIDTNGMKFKGAKKDGTLYLCSDCASQLYNGDDSDGIGMVDPKTMELLNFEVAEYACSEHCTECNQ